MRTLQSGHTVIRADQFDPDGWQLPDTTELCQDKDERFATNYMSAIVHVYQRTRCMDDDTPAGDHDSTLTRSCRPRQKTTPNVDGPTRSHPSNLSTSSSQFKRGEPTHCVSQNHERDIWTSSRRDQPQGDSTTWNTMDGETVETPRPLHDVRAMRGILRHPVPRTSDAEDHERDGDELFAVKGKGKGGFKGICFKCGMRGHEADRSWQKGKGKGGKGDWEKGKGGSKGKSGLKENGQNSGHMWDNSCYPSNWHSKTYGLEADPWTAVEPVLYLCAVSLKSSCEEYSKPKRVMRGTHTKTSQSGSPGDFVHVNKNLNSCV